MPKIEDKQYTYAEIGKILGMTAQGAQQRHERVQSIHGTVTWALMRQARHQSPAVAARKLERALSLTEQKIVSFARQQGVIHAAMRYDMPEKDIRALLSRSK